MTITMEDIHTPRLYLRQGEARKGAILYEAGDDGDLLRFHWKQTENFPSSVQMQETLAAGTYTIEATVHGWIAGSFTFTVSGVGPPPPSQPPPPPPPPPPLPPPPPPPPLRDTCVERVSRDGTHNGEWAWNCFSWDGGGPGTTPSPCPRSRK